MWRIIYRFFKFLYMDAGHRDREWKTGDITGHGADRTLLVGNRKVPTG